ncbi:hypothetical protein OH77DRAFT_1009596 [Trametes cingulata]|nr:hypothetical protein OH77DRAFT_1009596 [Trametes cingulata]
MHLPNANTFASSHAPCPRVMLGILVRGQCAGPRALVGGRGSRGGRRPMGQRAGRMQEREWHGRVFAVMLGASSCHLVPRADVAHTRVYSAESSSSRISPTSIALHALRTHSRTRPSRSLTHTSQDGRAPAGEEAKKAGGEARVSRHALVALLVFSIIVTVSRSLHHSPLQTLPRAPRLASPSNGNN